MTGSGSGKDARPGSPKGETGSFRPAPTTAAATPTAAGLYTSNTVGGSMEKSGYGSDWGGGCYGGYPYKYGCGGYYPSWNCGWWGGYGGYCGYGGFGGYWGGGFGIGWGCGWRFGFGFGYSYYPSYYYDCWYPYYRCYSYYPYHYYSTIAYYPCYAPVYHSDAVVSSYADVSDPYVEFTEEPASAPAPAGRGGGKLAPVAPESVPEPLRAPLYEGFPSEIRQGAELAMRAESWMKEGRYLEAAEARRRQFLGEPTNPSIAFHLGVALFAAAKYDLSSVALNEALDLDPRIVAATPASSGFASEDAFERARVSLERHVVKNPTDGSARFVLGSMDLASGRYFAARNEFSLLKDAAPESPHVATLLAEADKRFLEAAPESR